MNDPRDVGFEAQLAASEIAEQERPKIEMTSADREVEGILDGEMEAGQYRLLRAQCLIAQQLARIADTLDNWNRSGIPVEKVP